VLAAEAGNMGMNGAVRGLPSGVALALSTPLTL
jgi:hypothetical protein